MRSCVGSANSERRVIPKLVATTLQGVLGVSPMSGSSSLSSSRSNLAAPTTKNPRRGLRAAVRAAAPRGPGRDRERDVHGHGGADIQQHPPGRESGAEHERHQPACVHHLCEEDDPEREGSHTHGEKIYSARALTTTTLCARPAPGAESDDLPATSARSCLPAAFDAFDLLTLDVPAPSGAMFFDPGTRELLRVRSNPVSYTQAHGIRGARPAGPPPRPWTEPVPHPASPHRSHRR
jgi:hypothetical protein